MKVVRLADHQITNLRIFLDRIEYKGLSETSAVMEIMIALNMAQEEVQTIQIMDGGLADGSGNIEDHT